MIKKMLVRAAAVVALVGGLIAFGAAPAQAATANYYRNCASGYASITASNYNTTNGLWVTAYNASTGAYISQITIGPGASRNWITSQKNVRFYLSGVAFGANTWCS